LVWNNIYGILDERSKRMAGKELHTRKVVIVGAGSVGATFAYALAMRGVSDEKILTKEDV